MAKKIRIGIIGTGWVGASVAISVLQAGIAGEVFLHDARREVAEGEALDLAHGAAFYPGAAVRYADIDEMHDTDAIVLAAGRGGRPGESRLDLLKDNATIVRGIATRFRDYAGVAVIVTNPVDVMTSVFAATSELPGNA